MTVAVSSRATLTTGTAVSGSNVAATFQANEPALSGASATTRQTVWYTWTAASAGTYTVSTAGSSFDTVLGVYDANEFTGLTNVRQNDDCGTSGTHSCVTVTVTTGGTVYAIQVDGFGGLSGAIALIVTSS